MTFACSDSCIASLLYVLHLNSIFPLSAVAIQKTVTLATPSEEPVTVSMLYLSSDLNVILLYLKNSSDSADTFKFRSCLPFNEIRLRGLKMLGNLDETAKGWCTTTQQDKSGGWDILIWQKSKSRERSLEHLRRSAENHVEVCLCVQGSNAQH